MDRTIEKYIQQHRDALDIALPGHYAWQGVERALGRFQTADGLERQLLYDRVLLDTAEPPATLWANIENALQQSTINNQQSGTLEQFIRQHRDEFDEAVPDLRVWEALSRTAAPEEVAVVTLRVIWQRRLLRVAAAVALLIVGAGLGMFYQHQQNTAVAGMRLGEVSDEYAEVEQHYERDITGKRERLAQFASRPVAEDVLSDLEQMDQTMHELQQELANVPLSNREQVVRAMIENYKAKAAILERVLDGLEQEEQFNSNKNTAPSPTGPNDDNKHENARI